MIRILPAIMTCAARKEVFEQTLANLRQTDWAVEPYVQVDCLNHPNRALSGTCTALAMLQQTNLKDGFDYLLFMEDDLLFNKHIWHNLQSWKPLQDGVDLASLYMGYCFLKKIAMPGEGSERVNWKENYYWQKSRLFACSQACLIKRKHLPHILDGWGGVPTPEDAHDLRLSELMSRVTPYAYYHLPNLVQHTNPGSTMGNPLHSSPQFSLDWRA